MLFPDDLAPFLLSGDMAVIPTDTLYGIVCCADSPKAVEKLYRIRERDESKPCIILISDEGELRRFGIKLSVSQKQALKRLWPGKVSVVFDCPPKASDILTYLHRRTNTLAFRVPGDRNLRTFLKKSGPLLAPSANKEGKEPAQTIEEAKESFGESVGFYVDGGRLDSLSSTIVRLRSDSWEVLREGAVTLAPLPIV